jgi:ubiquinone/menaquinone biosynthesis C-methylase UbiE
MNLSRRLAYQLARPDGAAGRLLGNAMDIVNRRPLRLAVDMLAPAAGETVLDAGCGTGAAMAAMLERAQCRVIGVDASGTMLGMAQRRLGSRASFMHAALETLDLPAASIDAVLALNVLYFNDDQNRMLAELRRVLRPGGRLVAYVTDRASMADWSFTREGLHRLYDADTLMTTLIDCGFAQERCTVHEVTVTRSVKGLLAFARR